MPSHSGQYIINASAKEVFDYMDDPDNAVKATPSLKNATIIEDGSNGKRIEADYSLGKIVNGQILLEEEKRVENELIRFNINGDIRGFVEWTFEDSEDDNCIFTYRSEYKLNKISAPSFLVDKVAAQIDKHNMKSFISNLRSDLEK